LAAAIARRAAERELFRRIVMVDANDGRARGKALDLAQSGPVESYDVALEGCAQLSEAGRFDALVVADPPVLDDGASGTRGDELARGLLPAVGEGPVVVAGLQGAPVVEALVRAGLARERALGSTAIALASALRQALARELDVAPAAVAATVLGLPGHLVMPQGAVTVGGAPLERLSPVAGRRALAAVSARALGPVALAAGAVTLLKALRSSRATVLPVIAVLAGEYGHRGAAAAVPARVGSGRLLAVLEAQFEPVDRVAFDNAVSFRSPRVNRD
ncbi:MAG TPA: hypothetical protein VFO85_17630, partial [Vicinamibacteria bacterium]|nr:hypothetical protein [Vicinamibacteria bacterium]